MAETITKDMNITEIVQKYPQVAEVFFKHGMHCLGCAAAHFETLEQGCTAHGIDVEAILKDLNKAIENKSESKLLNESENGLQKSEISEKPEED